MIDPNSRHGRELKAAEEFFALARTATSSFMRAYYQRVAERYLSSERELKSLKGPDIGVTNGERIPADVGCLGQGWPGTWMPAEGEGHDGAIEQSGSLPERGGQVPRIG
jgi:hypothetical protein